MGQRGAGLVHLRTSALPHRGILPPSAALLVQPITELYSHKRARARERRIGMDRWIAARQADNGVGPSSPRAVRNVLEIGAPHPAFLCSGFGFSVAGQAGD